MQAVYLPRWQDFIARAHNKQENIMLVISLQDTLLSLCALQNILQHGLAHR